MGGGGLCRPPGRGAWWNTRDRLINLTSEWHITHTHTSLLHQRGGQSKRLCASMPTPSRGFIFREHSWDLSGVRATDQLVSAKKKTLGVLSTIRWQIRKRGERYRYRDTNQRVKLAAVETKSFSEGGKASRDGTKTAANGPGGRDSPKAKTVLVELAWDVPMSMMLPIQVKTDATHQPLSFLDATPAEPGTREWVSPGI